MLSVVVACLMTVGCGAVRHSVAGSDLPPTHRQAAETAIRYALKNAAMRAGEKPVSFSVKGAGDGVSIVEAVLPEELKACGFILVDPARSNAETVSVTLDSLSVVIVRNKKKIVRRTGTARVSVIHTSSDASRRVYVGEGVYEDNYDRRLLETSETETYITDRSSVRRFVSVFKPVMIGTVLTVFTWALYSYRG